MSLQRVTLAILIPLCLVLWTGCGQKKKADASILRISCETDPQTLDPRRVRDLNTATSIHMLYEGLMRIDSQGHPAPALAEEVIVSTDQKVYLFKLRRSGWSNGQPVTAGDFEQTWKSMLDPEFPSPNAYQLYVIEGAQEAKEGRAPLDAVGVKAIDDRTLVVQLEKPTPHFLPLAATHFFYPVHASLRQSSLPSETHEKSTITNGPFKLEKWRRSDELTAIPNPYYWDKGQVRLQKIVLIQVDNPTALQLFQQGALDWTGSPLSTLPNDALGVMKQQYQLDIKQGAGIYFFRFNTQQAPLNHPKIRQALTFALNRSDLVEHVLQGNEIPATRLVPPSFLSATPLFSDNDAQRARQLLKEALEEQNLALPDLPKMTLLYASGERAHKIAQVAQQQWKEALGINVDLQSCERKVYFDRLKSSDYQIGIGSWFADYADPIAFLEVFKFKDNGTNNTAWEHPHYIELLNRSSTVPEEERTLLLKEAEGLLIQEMPMAPLFFSSYNYLQTPFVKGVYFSELGYLDFKHAYLEPAL